MDRTLKNIFVILISAALLFSSCSKKRGDESAAAQQVRPALPPPEMRTDTSGTYVSPSDMFRDNSPFDRNAFRARPLEYNGNRQLLYAVTSRSLRNRQDSLMLVVEYLTGAGAEDSRTVTRLLVYLNNVLSYRKAFPVEIDDAGRFTSVRSFDRTFFDAAPAKAIIHYWIDVQKPGEQPGSTEMREFHSVGVDKEGIVGDLTGFFRSVRENFESVRFVREDRVNASIVPDSRYRNVAVDVTIAIDWKANTTSLEVPPDTVFRITGEPVRYFGGPVRLYSAPDAGAEPRLLNLRRVTRGTISLLFAPSLFSRESIVRDRMFARFTAANKGWVDHAAMVNEEIIARE